MKITYHEGVLPLEGPSMNSLRMWGLLALRPGTYYGTANPKKVAKRRAKNKVARMSRRANR